MNARTKYIISHIAVSMFAVLVLVATGWISRGLLMAYSDDWRGLQYTLSVVVPAVLYLIWVTVDETFIRNGFIRFAINVVGFIAVVVWFMNSTYPIGYQWSDGLPALGILALVLALGVSFVSWLKPHMASWPFWR